MSDLPVYDRYVPGTTLWEKIQFIAGRALQSAELNEVQSLILDVISSLGGGIFGDGDVVDGVTPTVTVGNILHLDAGLVYFHGRIRKVAATDIALSGIGEERIGIKGVARQIDDTDDITLLDPAIGSFDSNYGEPGAARQLIELVWSINDDNAKTIFVYQNGKLFLFNQPENVSQIQKLIARYIYDLAGHFRVRGFKALLTQHQQGAHYIHVHIEPGLAYVTGFPVNKPSTTGLKIPRATAHKRVPAEQFIYKPSGSDAELYYLNSKPVRKVRDVYANVQVTQPITRSIETFDNLPLTPVVNIVTVTYGTGGSMITYTNNVNYTQMGNTISWITGAPPQGAQYQVTWVYTKTLVKGVRQLTKVMNEPVVSLSGSALFDGPLVHSDLMITPSTTASLTPDGEIVAGYGTSAFTKYAGSFGFANHSGRTRYTQVLGPHGPRWNPAGYVPPSGSVYYLNYEYWAHTVEGDYTSVDSYIGPSGTVQGNRTQYIHPGSPFQDPWDDYDLVNAVDFRPVGSEIVTGSTVTVDYAYFKARRDVIGLDAGGNYQIFLGGHGIKTQLKYPAVPDSVMPILLLEHSPNAQIRTGGAKSGGTTALRMGTIKQYVPHNMRYTQADVSAIERRVSNIEISLALDSLEKDAANVITDDEKLGIFADSFTDLSKADMYFRREENPSLYTTVNFDLQNGQIKLPFDTTAINPKIDENASTVFIGKNIVTKIFDETLHLAQDLASEVLPMNLFGTNPTINHMELSPGFDFWVDTDQPPKVASDSILALSSPDDPDSTIPIDEINAGLFSQLDDIYSRIVGIPQIEGDLPSDWQSAGGLVHSEDIVPMMRQLTITVSGRMWHGSLQNIAGFFDGVPVDLIAVSPTSQGVNTIPDSLPDEDDDHPNGYTTVNSDSRGTFTSQFTIPENTSIGVRYLVCRGVADNGVVHIGQVPFIGQPIIDPVNTLYTSVKGRPNSNVPQVTTDTEPAKMPLLLHPTYTTALGGVPQTFAVSGGRPPYHISVAGNDTSGVLSDNLLSEAGEFTWVPIVQDGFNHAMLRVVDENGAFTISAVLHEQTKPTSSIVRIRPEVIRIGPGQATRFFIAGGIPPYTLNASGGTLSATPTTPYGFFTWTAPNVALTTSYTITGTASSGAPALATVIVDPSYMPGAFDPVVFPFEPVILRGSGQRIDYWVFAGTPPYSVSLSGGHPTVGTGTLDTGILNTQGVFGYTGPDFTNTTDAFQVTVTVQDTTGKTISSLILTQPVQFRVLPTDIEVYKGQGFDICIEGGTPPYSLIDVTNVGTFTSNGLVSIVVPAPGDNAYGPMSVSVPYSVNDIDFTVLKDGAKIQVTDSTGLQSFVNVNVVAADQVQFVPTALSNDELIELFDELVPATNAVGTQMPTETVIAPIGPNPNLAKVSQVSIPGAYAMIFKPRSDTYLSAVRLAFASADPDKPIKLRIRAVNNGFPADIIEEEVIDGDQITISTDSSQYHKIKFSDPVYLEAAKFYAMDLLTESTKYSIFIARNGSTDLVTGALIQHISEGIMLTSPNGETWTPHQNLSWKFRLLAAEFNAESGIIIFDNITGIEASHMLIKVTNIITNSAQIRWFYSLDNGVTWEFIDPAVSVSILENTFTQVKLKADLTGSTFSPVFNRNHLGLLLRKHRPIGEYISKNVFLPSTVTFSNLKIIMKYNPSLERLGQAYPYYTLDDGLTWQLATLDSRDELGQGWRRDTYTNAVDPTSNQFRIRLHLEIDPGPNRIWSTPIVDEVIAIAY